MSKTRARRTVGQRLKAKRLASGLSRKGVVACFFGYGVSITEKAVWRWESDINTPSVDNAAILRELFKMRI